LGKVPEGLKGWEWRPKREGTRATILILGGARPAEFHIKTFTKTYMFLAREVMARYTDPCFPFRILRSAPRRTEDIVLNGGAPESPRSSVIDSCAFHRLRDHRDSVVGSPSRPSTSLRAGAGARDRVARLVKPFGTLEHQHCTQDLGRCPRGVKCEVSLCVG
jgi:hypothetical protein